MFEYTDPTGTGFLATQGALAAYQATLQSFYSRFADEPNSAFTLLEAFQDISPGTPPTQTTVGWLAFPKSVNASDNEIDADRASFQDEYVEWHAEKTGAAVQRITFTTEFPEYFEALATVSHDALVAGIRQVIPGADPSVEDLYGGNFNPVTTSGASRARLFRSRLGLNPWNNGQRGILCLFQQFNTMGALFNLVGRCSVPKPNLQPGQVCGNVGGACGPNRDSDPAICQATQILTIAQNGLSLADPVGVGFLRLLGDWEVDGQEVDINDPSDNRGVWQVIRNRRRAVLDLTGHTVTLNGNSIASGTQVSHVLRVGATVVSAPDNLLPDWARRGNENLRMPIA